MSNRALIPLAAAGACLASLGFILMGGGPPAAHGAAGLEAPVEAPDFVVERIGGGTVAASDLAGKVIVVDIWATWCGPCIAEIPGYDRIAEQYAASGVEIIGVAVDSGSAAQIEALLRDRFPSDYTLAVANQPFERAFAPLWAIPTTLLIDREWRIRKVWTGALPDKHRQLRQLIDQLLSEPSAPADPPRP